MVFSPELKRFISEHLTEKPEKLLLSASHYPDIEMKFAAGQIRIRQQIREKLPSWYTNTDLFFPSRLSAEQCSSELTAAYKQQFMRGHSFCDLTGGLGIDTFYFSRKASKAYYIERFPEYCDVAMHNFTMLGIKNIEIINADSRDIASTIEADTFYADPARRAESNQRIFALSDCEPDILQLKKLLLSRCFRLIIKISPMADIGESLRLLPETQEIHILSVKNECKELLYILQNDKMIPPEDVKIHALDLHPSFGAEDFVFTLKEEKGAILQDTDQPGRYVYEPHAALLKSGAFKLVAARLNLKKLHKHSHLYTSDVFCRNFPGRSFTLDETLEFSGKLLKNIRKQVPRANLSVRNFPLSVAELRKHSNIKEGGDVYLFATTLRHEKKVLLLTHKAKPL